MSDASVALWVNGERRDTTAADVASLVETLRLPPQTLLVEHNGTALLRDEWAATSLRAGDRLELVRFVAGG